MISCHTKLRFYRSIARLLKFAQTGKFIFKITCFEQLFISASSLEKDDHFLWTNALVRWSVLVVPAVSFLGLPLLCCLSYVIIIVHV